MNIYIASPLFNEIQKDKIKKVTSRLRAKGHFVYSPMEHQIPNAWELSNTEWAQKVFQDDLEALKLSDGVFAIYYGMDSDSGTAWEIGYACAMGLDVRVFVPDKTNLQSLMVVNSANGIYNLNAYIETGAIKSILPNNLIQS